MIGSGAVGPALQEDPLTPQLTRRQALARGGLSMAAVMLGTGALPNDRAFAATPIAGDLYPLGVASGDPLPDGVVLWTRLAPDPLAEDGLGGMPPRPVRVRWEVAEDDGFRRVVRRGDVVALPALAHAVHPEVRGLRPGDESF